MRIATISALALLTVSCATNQLHFADFTDAPAIAKIKNTTLAVHVTDVAAPAPCQPCRELSSIVWHAANFDGRFYEGFFPLPVSDWKALVSQALTDTPPVSTKEVRVELRRVFLKTWQNPRYAACLVELAVTEGEQSRSGTAYIKLRDMGQLLILRDLVRLDPQYVEVVRLAIRAAYANAVGQ